MRTLWVVMVGAVLSGCVRELPQIEIDEKPKTPKTPRASAGPTADETSMRLKVKLQNEGPEIIVGVKFDALVPAKSFPGEEIRMPAGAAIDRELQIEVGDATALLVRAMVISMGRSRELKAQTIDLSEAVAGDELIIAINFDTALGEHRMVPRWAGR